MTEDEARSWLSENFAVPRETFGKLENFVRLLDEGRNAQNLISESTWPHIWARHIVDSAQLIPLVDQAGEARWVDLGAGAGLPAIVVAILSSREVVMIETRRKRVEFLQHVIDTLGLRNAYVHAGRVETAPPMEAAVISARAYAPLPKLFSTALHLSTEKTIWVLPKGRNAENELEQARPSWQGVFHVERSVTDADSAIIVARAVKPRGGEGRG